MKDIVYIHGAWSTPNSFNYINKVIEDKRVHNIVYDCSKERLPNIVKRAKEELKNIDNEVTIVAHSLGGIVAIGLEKEENVKNIVTLASPLAGLKLNTFFRLYLLTQSSILNDATPDSSFLYNLHREKYTKPIRMLVACEGFNPYILEPNDGVVTVSSQVGWMPESGSVLAINCNHHEILQSDISAEVIKKALT